MFILLKLKMMNLFEESRRKEYSFVNQEGVA
jgi:hypothetical protein